MRFIAVSNAVLLVATVALAQSNGRSTMTDPVFGMVYDTKKIHFESAPNKIIKLCRDLHGERPWVYASLNLADAEYFVLSDAKSETSGVGIVVKGGRCAVSLPDWLLYGLGRPDNWDKSLEISNSAMNGLAQDLFRRYTSAFGGKANFIEAVSKGGLALGDLPSRFRNQFEAFKRHQ